MKGGDWSGGTQAINSMFASGVNTQRRQICIIDDSEGREENWACVYEH